MAKFDYESYPGDYQYKALNSRYRMQRVWHNGKLALIDNNLTFKKNEIILDFGCGSGNLCFHLANRCKEIYGIDIKRNAIAFCKNRKIKEGHKNCHFSFSDGDKLPFRDKTFDKVFLLDVIEHIENPAHTLKEIHRILADAGLLIITTPNYLSAWPVLEFCADILKITPQNEEQHITKFTKRKLDTMLTSSGFIPKTKSVYLISPFFPFSKYLLRLLKWELKVNTPGMLLYSVAEKNVF